MESVRHNEKRELRWPGLYGRDPHVSSSVCFMSYQCVCVAWSILQHNVHWARLDQEKEMLPVYPLHVSESSWLYVYIHLHKTPFVNSSVRCSCSSKLSFAWLHPKVFIETECLIASICQLPKRTPCLNNAFKRCRACGPLEVASNNRSH